MFGSLQRKILNQKLYSWCGFSSHRISSCDDGIECFLRTPLYRLAAGFDVDKIFVGATHLFNMGSLSVTLNPTYLLTVVLPFNALQYIIFALVFGLIVAVFKKNKVVKFYNA